LIQQIFQVLVCSSVEEGMISTVLHDCTEGLDEEIGCKNPALFFMPGLPQRLKVLKGTCKMKPKNLPIAKPSFKPISEPLACKRNSLESRPENQGCLKKIHQHLTDQTCQYKKKRL